MGHRNTPPAWDISSTKNKQQETRQAAGLHGQCRRISRATEVSGTRPQDRMRRRRRRGSGAPRRLSRRTGKAERGSEEARPAPTTGPRRRAREPAPRRAPPAASVQPTCGPGASPGRSERGGGGATAGEDSTPDIDKAAKTAIATLRIKQGTKQAGKWNLQRTTGAQPPTPGRFPRLAECQCGTETGVWQGYAAADRGAT